MSEVELEVVKGSIHFRGRGPQEWVEAQFAKVFQAELNREPDAETNRRAVRANSTPELQDRPEGGDRKAIWMARHQVTEEELDRVFHQEGTEFQLIASALPGGSNKDRCINAYILVGLRSVLSGKEGRFTDENAREVCAHYGAYDLNNHAKVLNNLRPEITGSKSAGWQLTAPGHSKAAQLVKQIAGVE